MGLTKFRFGLDDFDGDLKTTSYDTQDVTLAGGFAAWQTKLASLQSGLALWSVGREHLIENIVVVEDNGPGKSLSPISASSSRLILEGQDVLTGVIYRYPLPMPDLGKAADGGADAAWIATGQGQQSLTVANPLHADYTTLKTAFEAIVRSPNDNAVTLARAYIEE